MAAAASGITSFKATMLAENLAAHHLVRGFAATPTAERHLGPVDEIEVDLARERDRGCDHRARAVEADRPRRTQGSAHPLRLARGRA